MLDALLLDDELGGGVDDGVGGGEELGVAGGWGTVGVLALGQPLSIRQAQPSTASCFSS